MTEVEVWLNALERWRRELRSRRNLRDEIERAIARNIAAIDEAKRQLYELGWKG